MLNVFSKSKTKEYYVEYLFRELKEIERSNYFYSEKDKLYPDDERFYQNSSWANYILKIYKKDKLNRFKRSDYYYKDKDKLMPTDKLFFENNSWKVVEEQKNREELALGNFKESFLN